MFCTVTSHEQRCGFLADMACSVSNICLASVYFFEKFVEVSFWEINIGVLCKTASITVPLSLNIVLRSTGYLYLMNPFIMEHLIIPHTCPPHYYIYINISILVGWSGIRPRSHIFQISRNSWSFHCHIGFLYYIGYVCMLIHKYALIYVVAAFLEDTWHKLKVSLP